MYLNENFCCCSVSKSCLTATPLTAVHQPSLSFTVSWSLLRLHQVNLSIKLMMPSNISSSVIPFSSCPQCFSASGSFPMSQLFTSGGPSIGASASVLPMNIQDWFPLGLIGLIPLLSKGLSRVFSNTTVRKDQFFGVQHFYNPSVISVYDYWKNHNFDYTDLCQQSNISDF